MREIVDAVKTAVPDAANRPAGKVFEYVRSRLTDSVENASSMHSFEWREC